MERWHLRSCSCSSSSIVFMTGVRTLESRLPRIPPKPRLVLAVVILLEGERICYWLSGGGCCCCCWCCWRFPYCQSCSCCCTCSGSDIGGGGSSSDGCRFCACTRPAGYEQTQVWIQARGSSGSSTDWVRRLRRTRPVDPWEYVGLCTPARAGPLLGPGPSLKFCSDVALLLPLPLPMACAFVSTPLVLVVV